MAIYQTPSWWQIHGQIDKGLPTWGAEEQFLTSMGDSFKNVYKQYLGADPTEADYDRFYREVGMPMWQTSPGFKGLSQFDTMGATQAWLPSAYSGEIEGRQESKAREQEQQRIAAQRSAFSSNQDLLQQALQKSRASTTDYYTTGAGSEQIKRTLNSRGLMDSGAFPETLANVLAQADIGMQQNAFSNFGIPTVSGMQNLSGSGIGAGQSYLNGLNNQGLQQQNQLGQYSRDLYGLGLQRDWAREIAEMGQPSGFEKNLGYANTASSIASNMGTPMAMGAQMTSYVCKELIKRNLICESDMDDFHVHIMPAMFKKGRAFWKYAMDGFKLVDAANKKGLDWSAFKTLLFDRVMAEKDPCKAVDLYADACRQLCQASDPTLWDEKVMRTGYLDSLPFLPRLFSYQPFREALAKCLRIKMLIIYDKPRCEVHHGA